MKLKITILLALVTGLINAQAFKGKGDLKGQIGANFQDGGNGIFISTDFGIGENISYGFSGNFLLSKGNILGEEPKLEDKVDFKARFNLNIGKVFKMNPKMDVYPGLDLGMKNFGGHLGFRYFFSDGFGLFVEGGYPLTTYKNKLVGIDYYNNQFVLNVGTSFNF